MGQLNFTFIYGIICIGDVHALANNIFRFSIKYFHKALQNAMHTLAN